MGTTPMPPPVDVRVVLPDDTLMRVPVSSETTAGGLIARIQEARASHRTEYGGETPERWELALVRSGFVFRETDVLPDAGVCEYDILEWRAVKGEPAQCSSPPLHDKNGLELDEPETLSSDLDSTDLPDAEPSTERVLRKDSTVRPPRRRLSSGVGRLARSVPISSHRRLRASSARKDDALTRMMPRDFFLRASFDCVDRLESVQSLCRQLLMQVRDIYSRLGPQPIASLFPVVQALASQTSELVCSDANCDGNTPSLSVRWMYPLISRSVHGTELPVIMQGYVDVAEWVALWRNQRRVYACLCDGAKLLLFAHQKLCEEFVFELAMRGSASNALDPAEEQDHRRFLKENAPHTTIDLIASKWNVRRGETASAEAKDGATRHAFALFDTNGKLRLIMDVATQLEADQWILAIKTEITQCKLLNSAVTSAPGTANSKIQARNLSVPLRWLHSYVDSMSRGQARVERVKSWTLTQALKDLRRDCLQINGIVYSGLCVEEIVGALLMEITRLASTLTPVDAMQFMRLLLVTSSRTQGGGDILDAMRLAVGLSPTDGTGQVCFCPVEATQIGPIQINISNRHNALVHSEGSSPADVVAADIRMEMRYRVFMSGDIRGDVAHWETPPEGTSRETGDSLLMTGVYHRQLLCSGEHWNRMDGTVVINVDEE